MSIPRLTLIIFTLILFINAYLHLHASTGCLDNSWHLEKFPDNKEYHEVNCNCPCWKYKTSSDRNRCLRCMHYHTDTPSNPEKNKAHSTVEHALKSEKIVLATAQSVKQPIGRIVYKK